MHRSTCLLVVGVLAGCARSPGSNSEVTFWAMGVEGEKIRALVPEFERRHPGLKVRVQSIPWSAAHEKLLTAFAGGATPDACQLGNTWLPEFQAIGALQNLDPYIATSMIVDPQAFFPGIRETNTMGRKVYGVPWYVDTRVLFYRTDIFQRAGIRSPPQDWEQWLDTARRIKRLNPDRYPVFLSLIHTEWQVPVILIMQNGGRLLREQNGRAAFDDSATVEALRFYLQFFEENLAPRRMTEVANLFQAFGCGFIAMMITGPWNVNELRKRYPDLETRWSTARLPGKRNRASVAGGSSLVLFKNARNPEGAWKWIEFLSLPETQVRFFELTSDLPARPDAWRQGGLLSDEKMVAFFAQLQDVRPTPKIAEWEQVATKLQEHLERVIFGRATLDEAVRSLNADVDRILEKRRWLVERGFFSQ